MTNTDGMFAGIRPETVIDAEKWLYAHGYHDRGDFTVQFGHGGVIDLRQVVADFAELHNSALIGRVHAWQRIAEETIARTLPPPIIVQK